MLKGGALDNESDDGIKKLAVDNWLERDPIMHAFQRLDSRGGSRPLTMEVLAGEFLSVELSPSVPTTIQTLYRTSRGVLPYGYFFYPLYAVAVGELSRTAEAALNAKYKALGGPRSRRNFKGQIEWLHEKGELIDREAEMWQTIRRERNETAHPEYQLIEDPSGIRFQLRFIAHCISCLFDDSIVFESFWLPGDAERI